MRQPLPFHYCNTRVPCKHICLTVITPILLLLVACHSDRSVSSPAPAPAAAVSKAVTSPATNRTASSRTPPTAQPGSGNWQSLFDGKSLNGWAVTDFAGHGEVRIENGSIILGQGVMTGINWTNPLLAEMGYEIALDAMRVDGSDFF